ncbi:MAG: hypothetical protein AAFZ07_23235 [Actinomycetota bacterium]
MTAPAACQRPHHRLLSWEYSQEVLHGAAHDAADALTAESDGGRDIRHTNYCTRAWTDSIERLGAVDFEDLDLRPVHRDPAVRSLLDYLVALITVLERAIHPDHTGACCDRSQDCHAMACHRAIAIFIGRFLSEQGLERAKVGPGSGPPRRKLYCHRRLGKLRKGLRRSWPGIDERPAPIIRLEPHPIDVWELDAGARSVIDEISCEFARVDVRPPWSRRRIARSLRRSMRRVLRRHRRHGSEAALARPLLRAHPWAEQFAAEGWPGFELRLRSMVPWSDGAQERATAAEQPTSRGLAARIAAWWKALMRRTPLVRSRHRDADGAAHRGSWYARWPLLRRGHEQLRSQPLLR